MKLLPQVPFSKEETADLLHRFNRDGVLKVGQVYTPEECAHFRKVIDRAFDDPALQTEDRDYGPIVRPKLFELDAAFVGMLTREPVASLMEALLGVDCHVIANNTVRNPPGQSIDTFHVDDFLWVPLPPEIPRHDPRMTFPTYLVNAVGALTDIPSVEYGPLQYVPGSHYAGRDPNDLKNPTFDGRGLESMFAAAGEVYLQHPQVWHRGAPNVSNRTRYISGAAYSKRFVAQRFYPFMNYQVPAHVLAGASERTLRMLGKHPKGPYG